MTGTSASLDSPDGFAGSALQSECAVAPVRSLKGHSHGHVMSHFLS